MFYSNTSTNVGISKSLKNTYTKKGSHLISKNLHLLIARRKKTTPNKSNLFLLALDKENKKRSYISSLYPLNANLTRFSLDYNGVNYTLSLNGSNAVIESTS